MVVVISPATSAEQLEAILEGAEDTEEAAGAEGDTEE